MNDGCFKRESVKFAGAIGCTTRLVLLLGSVMTASCGNESDMAALTRTQLHDKASDCRALKDPAPGRAISCDNLLRECKRRSAERGYKVC